MYKNTIFRVFSVTEVCSVPSRRYDISLKWKAIFISSDSDRRSNSKPPRLAVFFCPKNAVTTTVLSTFIKIDIDFDNLTSAHLYPQPESDCQPLYRSVSLKNDRVDKILHRETTTHKPHPARWRVSTDLRRPLELAHQTACERCFRCFTYILRTYHQSSV